MTRWLIVALLLMTGGVVWAQTGPQTGPSGGAGGSGTVTFGASGPVTSSTVVVNTVSGSINAAGVFANFGRVCVDVSQVSGIWVNWNGGAATPAPPSDHIFPGGCIVWIRQTGYLPTGQWNAISDTSLATTAIVQGN